MSDPNKDPTVKQPKQPQEVPKLEDFKGVLGWVQKKKDESKTSGKPWGWIMGLVAAVVVFIALAYAAYTAWKKGREIAELKHKIDVDAEKKKQTEADAKIETNKTIQAELAVEAATLGNLIEETKKQITDLEKDRQAINNKIDKVTSWEELDNL
jgi:septal ring factor EnvC (AmiA/AmiB activator)